MKVVGRLPIKDKNIRWKIEDNTLHRLLSRRRYIPEFKALVLKLYKHGYRIHTIERAYKFVAGEGLSRRTIWNWIRNVKIKGIYPYFSKNVWDINTRASALHVAGVILRFLRWLRYKARGGLLDLDACLQGEEPP